MTTPVNTNSIKIHFFYVTLILTLIIVGLVTHKWTGISEFREYLNVGATVTSLVLGVLAIIYSFVSNGQQSSVLGAVEAAATTTSSSVAKLDIFMKSAQDLQNEASGRSKELHTLTEALGASVDSIKDETKALVAANREIAGKVSLLPDQIGEIRGIIEKAEKISPIGAISSSEDIKSQEVNWTRTQVEYALVLCSTYGLTTLESFVKGNEFKKDVSLAKLSEAVGDSDINYFWGFSVGVAMTRLIILGVRPGASGVFEILAVHPELKACLALEWNRRDGLTDGTEEKARLVSYQAHALTALVDPPAAEASLPG